MQSLRFRYHAQLFGKVLQLVWSTFLTYRVNAFINSLYLLTYVVGELFLLWVLFQRTQNLAGYSQSELLYIYFLASFVWSFIETFCFRSLLDFSRDTVRTGQLDMFLTKPTHPLFFVLFSHPNIEGIPFLLMNLSAFIACLTFLDLSFSVWQLLATIIAILASLMIVINVLLCYSFLALFTPKVTQIIRMTQTNLSHAGFPLTVYPRPLQVVMLTILPLAYLGYLPALVVLSDNAGAAVLGLCLIAMASIYLRWFFWNAAIKRYSSASG